VNIGCVFPNNDLLYSETSVVVSFIVLSSQLTLYLRSKICRTPFTTDV